MNVATILDNKGGNVVSARPEATIAEIAQLLVDAAIGAVVISPDRFRVAGILSERDIVRALNQHGAAALDMKAERLMTRDVTTCTPNDSVAKLMAAMTKGRFRHMPVLSDDALIGIVSIGDVVRLRVEEIEAEAEALRTYVTQS
jgi:CBS domain-containing protein